MTKVMNRLRIKDARNRLEQALSDLKQADDGDSDKLRSGLVEIEQSLRCISKIIGDRIRADARARWCDTMPDNVVIGVIAQCSCGNVFTDDVVVELPQPHRIFDPVKEKPFTVDEE